MKHIKKYESINFDDFDFEETESEDIFSVGDVIKIKSEYLKQVHITKSYEDNHNPDGEYKIHKYDVDNNNTDITITEIGYKNNGQQVIKIKTINIGEMWPWFYSSEFEKD